MYNFEVVTQRTKHILDIETFYNNRREGTLLMNYGKLPEIAWLQYLRVEDHKIINGGNFRRSGIGTIMVFKAMQDAHELGFSELLGELNAIPNGPEERRVAISFYNNLHIDVKDTKTLVAKIPEVIARCEEVVASKNIQFVHREK